MTKLTILRGISGSGKSTWARSQIGAVVVSRDDIRKAAFHDYEAYYKADKSVIAAREKVITQVEHDMIRRYLRAGMDVISDNTHTKMSYVNTIAKIGYSEGAEVEIKRFDVSLAVAKAAVKARARMGGHDVPVEAIERQFKQLSESKDKDLVKPFTQEVTSYTGTPGKPKAFLVDIDGTLAHMRDYRGPYEWANVELDDPDETIIHIANNLAFDNYGDKIARMIVMSGRDESCREQTERWLYKHGVLYDHLFMRPEGDMRKDNIIKHELFNKYVRDNYDVKFVLDDRQQVVDMWRKMGLKCLQVEVGDF